MVVVTMMMVVPLMVVVVVIIAATVLKAHHMHYLLDFSEEPYEAHTIIISILYIRKQGSEELSKLLVSGGDCFQTQAIHLQSLHS